MTSLEPIQAIEQFHLLFLAQLVRGVDKRMVVLKGGCNLRFFHRSVRYSEDMDLDVWEIDTHVLRDKITAIFGSRPFAQILNARGIDVEHVTEHKQTDTTQRWKLGLRTSRGGRPFPTKIECSRRGIDEGVELASIDPAIVRAYQLTPLMVSHYGMAAALRQKVGALAHRSQTQARDIFDLHHLIAAGAGIESLQTLDRSVLGHARERATSIDFAIFRSQVLSYLTPEDRARYDSADAWDTLVLELVERLDEAGR